LIARSKTRPTVTTLSSRTAVTPITGNARRRATAKTTCTAASTDGTRRGCYSCRRVRPR
jgi:hypothetical protein